MKKYFYKIFILIILSTNSNAQIVEINHHIGYDCTKTIDKEEMRGGCTTDILTMYHETDKSTNIYSKEIKTTQLFKPFVNGKFDKNQIKDSLHILTYKHKISVDEVSDLLELLTKIKKSKDSLNISPISHFQEIGKWNSSVLGTNRRKLKKFNSSTKTESKIENINDLNRYFKEILINKNQSIAISSLTETINISINHNDTNVTISQSNPGNLNIEWLIEIESKKYRVLSAELNSMIEKILSKHFEMRNKLLEYRTIDNLINIANK